MISFIKRFFKNKSQIRYFSIVEHIDFTKAHKFTSLTAEIQDLINKMISNLEPCQALLSDVSLQTRQYSVFSSFKDLSKEVLIDLDCDHRDYAKEFSGSELLYEYYLGNAILHKDCFEIVRRVYHPKALTGDLLYSFVIKKYKSLYYYWK